ncbi:hypothetical protein CBS63078_1389 [Aspergillus niger]|nr:hypothetical protein CBS115989_5640 [Aspergillus niger]KAI2831645.1 hypothetical protein CBS133816_2237 [Aspergillus niger]KAI2839115.1 hypothetical protein CBS12448_10788 [Aspergillus niger]KAI2853411.1 hypothetical protein CBS11350_149 [Aspergillus niger]KAI2861400.1 hypothetical protein CBS11232_1036 [Aspergillus niger]
MHRPFPARNYRIKTLIGAAHQVPSTALLVIQCSPPTPPQPICHLPSRFSPPLISPTFFSKRHHHSRSPSARWLECLPKARGEPFHSSTDCSSRITFRQPVRPEFNSFGRPSIKQSNSQLPIPSCQFPTPTPSGPRCPFGQRPTNKHSQAPIIGVLQSSPRPLRTSSSHARH